MSYPIPVRIHEQDIDNLAGVFKRACERLGSIFDLINAGIQGAGTDRHLDDLSDLLSAWEVELPVLQYWLDLEGFNTPAAVFSRNGDDAITHLLAWERTLNRIGAFAHPGYVRAVEGYALSVPGYMH